MRRRDAFRLIPCTLAGLGLYSQKAGAFDNSLIPSPGDPSIPLALQYINNVRDMLLWVRQNMSEKILESAYAIARTVMKGRTCWCYWDQGHTYHSDIFPGRNGEPEILTAGYDPEKAKDGDMLLANFPFGQEIFDDLDKKDIFVIGGPSPWGGDAKGYEWVTDDIRNRKIRPYADIWIETNITTVGPLVKIQGMPAPLGPISGPMNLTTLWMMLADACRVLSMENKPVKVKGDEPKLSGDSIPWVKLGDPLMDDFFEEILREMELIGAELGNIRETASMAVDTLLNGGICYFYSRYRESFAYEASGRRGGFDFSRPLFEGHIEGTSKDCVIMGIYEPDDEIDLKNLDEFKKRGMRTASVGPITRDFVIPEGRTVHKETDIHTGRTTDTYGLFAIPGFEKRVCPTSGIINNATLWAISMEIATQIIERTNGNVPAIHFNGALDFARQYNRRMRTLREDRGY